MNSPKHLRWLRSTSLVEVKTVRIVRKHLAKHYPNKLAMSPGAPSNFGDSNTLHLFLPKAVAPETRVSFDLVVLETVGAQRPAVRRFSRGEQRFRKTRPWVACGAEEDVDGVPKLKNNRRSSFPPQAAA